MRTRAFWPLIMLTAVVLLYAPPGALHGDFTLRGSDFQMLHFCRISFAQQHLAGATVPGWYPRELCGTPFWANVQNFPFVPTRLAWLWLPGELVFTASVIVSGGLAALFTYFFARRLSLSRPAAAVAGWTFAAAGFYASRIFAGHLPLLEAYPALPLLLWLVDRAAAAAPNDRRFDWRLIGLSVAACSVCLVGHPQLSIYALLTAGVFVLVRVALRRWLIVGGAMAAGAAIAAFALVPMMLLTARSTRVLPLDAPDNDIAMPFGRLLAAFFPWRDGLPINAPGREAIEFTRYPHAGYFWDTVTYVGWWPWIAMAILVALWAARRVRPDRRVWFIVVMSIAGLLLALPWVRQLPTFLEGTFLRSPARLIYLPTLGLSLAAGAGVGAMAQVLSRRISQRAATVAAAVVMIVHAIDLSAHDRAFIVRGPVREPISNDLRRMIETEVGDGRIGLPVSLLADINRQIDDVGFFDSIMLARSYQGLVAMIREAPPGYNNQMLDASSMDLRALRAAGVRVLLSPRPRPALPQLDWPIGTPAYRITDTASRAAFYFDQQAMRGDAASSLAALRDRSFDPNQNLIVEDGAAPTTAASSTAQVSPANVKYDRVSPDQIVVQFTAPADGYLRVLESFDPGWRATLDGQPAKISPANHMFMAVRAAAGEHTLQLDYSTPGKIIGALVSMVGIATAIMLAWFSSRCGQAVVAQELEN